MREIAAGDATVLTGSLVTAATGAPKTSGTIKALLRLDLDGDADDGKYWDTNANDWSPVATFSTTGVHPAATYDGLSGVWRVAVTAAMTTGKNGGVVELVDLTDDPTGAATTTMAGALTSARIRDFTADVQAALTAQGYTTGRAPNLDNLDAAISSISGIPSGTNSITITVETTGGDPVEGVEVAVYNAAGTVFIGSAITDVNGEASFTRDDGTYTIRLWKSLFVPTNATETLVVDGNEAETYTGTQFTPGDAPSASDCTISGYLADASGAVHANTTVDIYATTTQSGQGYKLTGRIVSATSDGAGLISFTLLRGITVGLICHAVGWDGTTKTVPSAASEDIADW